MTKSQNSIPYSTENLLSQINSPADLRRLPLEALPQVCDELREFIINGLHRGCSLYDVVGGYTNKPSREIQTLLTQTEFSDLMNFIKKMKIKAFITAGNVSEIYGEWSTARTRRQKLNGKSNA